MLIRVYANQIMKGFEVFKPFDFGAIGLAVSITILSAVFVYAGTGSPLRVTIKGAGETWLFSLDSRELIAVPGPLGDTVVEVREGKVRVLASPCDNQTCVAARAIRSHGQWIACLPNKVLVSIEGNAGETQDELDAAVW
jgi:hypothetical protein